MKVIYLSIFLSLILFFSSPHVIAGVGWHVGWSCRITSYNVCYTKLLRSPDSKWLAYAKAAANNFRQITLWSLEDNSIHKVTDTFARITSYNVCYTKLLRAWSEVHIKIGHSQSFPGKDFWIAAIQAAFV